MIFILAGTYEAARDHAAAKKHSRWVWAANAEHIRGYRGSANRLECVAGYKTNIHADKIIEMAHTQEFSTRDYSLD